MFSEFFFLRWILKANRCFLGNPTYRVIAIFKYCRLWLYFDSTVTAEGLCTLMHQTKICCLKGIGKCYVKKKIKKTRSICASSYKNVAESTTFEQCSVKPHLICCWEVHFYKEMKEKKIVGKGSQYCNSEITQKIEVRIFMLKAVKAT